MTSIGIVAENIARAQRLRAQLDLSQASMHSLQDLQSIRGGTFDVLLVESTDWLPEGVLRELEPAVAPNGQIYRMVRETRNLDFTKL